MEPIDYQQQVLTEIVAALGTGPEVTMSEIENSLGQIYAQHANDEWATTLIVDVWAKVNLVASAADNAINLAAAAREVATAVAKQRDEAIAAHNELQTAVRTFNTDHALVGDMVEVLTDDIYSQVMSDGYHTPCPGCEIIDNAEIDVPHDVAAIFHDCLTGQYLYDLPDPISAALRAELSAFMIEFVRKVTDAEGGAA